MVAASAKSSHTQIRNIDLIGESIGFLHGMKKHNRKYFK